MESKNRKFYKGFRIEIELFTERVPGTTIEVYAADRSIAYKDDEPMFAAFSELDTDTSYDKIRKKIDNYLNLMS